MKVVKRRGLALQYVSEELKGNRDIAMEVVKRQRFALEYASEELT
jgi:hypothetical protein